MQINSNSITQNTNFQSKRLPGYVATERVLFTPYRKQYAKLNQWYTKEINLTYNNFNQDVDVLRQEMVHISNIFTRKLDRFRNKRMSFGEKPIER